VSWRRPLATGLYVLAEALLWFVVLRTFATGVERNRFEELADAIALGIRGGDFLQPDRANDARALAEAAREAATGGAPLLVVLALAFGAFGLMRLLAATDLPASARAAAGVSVSIVAVTAGVQIAIATGAPWEGGLIGGITGNSANIVTDVSAAEFVANPDIDGVRGVSRTVTVVGLTLLWLRFLLAGRGAISFDRVLRSFGIGFAVAVVTSVLGRATDADVAGWLLMPYFVLATLALATAHAARAPEDDLAVRRDAPWAVSVFGTVGLLAAISVVFGLLVLVDAQRAFHPIGDAVATVLTWVLIIVLTPIAWVIEQLLALALGGPDPDAPVQVGGAAAQEEASREPAGRTNFPSWLGGIVRWALIAILGYLLYRLGMLVFRRRRGEPEEAYPEVRRVSSSGGLGALFRNLVPRPRGARGESWDWLARSRAYRLFGRMLSDAHARGLDRAAGQTPIEFGADAGRRLEAPPFPEIARTFDRARYGRHEPSADSLARLEGRLEEWERAHPLPEET
jgi:hypothetical protein